MSLLIRQSEKFGRRFKTQDNSIYICKKKINKFKLTWFVSVFLPVNFRTVAQHSLADPEVSILWLRLLIESKFRFQFHVKLRIVPYKLHYIWT